MNLPALVRREIGQAARDGEPFRTIMKHEILGASQRREAPNRKRSAVMALRGRFGVFERRARAGWQVNDKRIRRLWREEGLRVPQRRRKKRLSGVGVAVGAMSPIRPNVIWVMDFQFDTTADGRTVKMLNVIDEFTREALAIDVDRGIDADGVVDVLDRLVLHHGAPH